MQPHVVVIGAGFGGLEVVKHLAEAPCRITLIDRANHHTFAPLLYQVAMAGLSPAEIAMPTRAVFRDQRNCTVLLGEVTDVDFAKRAITLAGLGTEPPVQLDYDDLVIAVGAQSSYFGHPEWQAHAPGLKTLDDAVQIRNRFLHAFEAAEREPDPARQAALLTFVIIGAGPTGVELAGAIAELARFTLTREFRRIDPSRARVVLVEAGERVLATFSPAMSAKAHAQLIELGVEIRTGTRVTAITADAVTFATGEVVATHAVAWAAGVRGAGLLARLPVARDRQDRVMVTADCSIPDQPHVFVIGDAAHYATANGPLPGVSPVAMQQGRYVAQLLHARCDHREFGDSFAYVDKGSMATIGRSRAVVEAGKLKLSGLWAWLAWLFVHIFYLIGFRNRFVVLFTWAWSYVSYRRGARLITREGIGAEARLAPPPAHRNSVVSPSLNDPTIAKAQTSHTH